MSSMVCRSSRSSSSRPSIVVARGLRQPQADAERIEQLQPQPLLLVERRADVALEIGEAIAGDRLANRLAELLPQRAARRDGEDLRLGPSSACACSATKALTCSRSSAARADRSC